jgi:plasmid maintenance system antidote protein VapI
VSAEDDLRTHVRTELTKAKISQAEACRQLGCSTKHMNQMLMGHKPLSLDWAERILALCGKRLVIDVRRRPTA